MTVQILRKCFSFLLNLTTGAKIYVFHSYKGDVFILFCAVFELRYVDLVRGRFRLKASFGLYREVLPRFLQQIRN